MYKKTILILSAILILSNGLISQEIRNVHYEQDGKLIKINYDLTGGDKYDISIYFSMDGGTTWKGPLNKVTGAVGSGQKEGLNKQIVWDVLAEQEKLEGDIKFKIEARFRIKSDNKKDDKVGLYLMAGYALVDSKYVSSDDSTYEAQNQNKKARSSYQFGCGLKYKFSKYFSLRTEFGYISKGHKRLEPYYADTNGTVRYSYKTFKSNYLNLPILLNLQIGSFFNIEIGPEIGILLNPPENSSWDWRQFDLSLCSGLSFKIKQLDIGARYSLGISPRSAYDPTNTKGYNRYAEFFLRWSFWHK